MRHIFSRKVMTAAYFGVAELFSFGKLHTRLSAFSINKRRASRTPDCCRVAATGNCISYKDKNLTKKAASNSLNLSIS